MIGGSFLRRLVAPRYTADEAPDAVAAPAGHPRYPHMDGLRAIAALSVVAFHIGFVSNTNAYSSIGKWTNHLNVGVTVFFVISGFLLYRPFVAMRFGAPARGVRAYARNRALRILPAYWVSLTLLAIYPGLAGVFTGDWWKYYGLQHVYASETFFYGNPVGWSLAIELVFYAILPLYAWLMMRLRPGLRAELAVLLVLGAAGLALSRMFKLPTSFLESFNWFAAGMALAVASVHGALPVRRGLANGSWAAAAVLFLAFPWLMLWWPHFGSVDVWQNVLLAVIAALVVLPAVLPAGTGASLPHRVLSTRLAAWLGLVSYGIYLFHLGVLSAIFKLGWQDIVPGRTVVSYTLLALPATLALAALSYYLVERPALKFKSRRRRMVLPRLTSTPKKVRQPVEP